MADRQTAALARIRVEPFAGFGVEAEQIGVAGIVVDQPVVPEIPDADQAGHVAAHVELLAEEIVQLPQNPVRPQLVRRMNRDHLFQDRLDRRHGQRGVNAVSGNVAEYAQAALRIDRNPLEEVAADLEERPVDEAELITLRETDPRRQHGGLHLRRQLEVALDLLLELGDLVLRLIRPHDLIELFKQARAREVLVQVIRVTSFMIWLMSELSMSSMREVRKMIGIRLL